ncbi:putative serine/threonine-protein kinase fhkE [Trifolium repens]|nr:putative serine/threonine-protein kinase fhkE [Trifolium repens]
MDKESLNNHENSNNIVSLRDDDRDKNGGGDGSGSLLLRAISDGFRQSTTSDLVLQWGNRKRLRCMKVQVKQDSLNPVQRTTVRVDRRVVRTEKDTSNRFATSVTDNNIINSHSHNNQNQSNGYPSLRQRAPSPQQPPARILRNTENSGTAMRGTQMNGSVRGIASPERGGHEKHNNHHNNNNNKSAGSSDNALDGKKGGGSSSGSGDATPAVWPPKFVIALTNKEKEEDFMAIKGSKLPQRPKKRAKLIQRTLNLVSPGTWLSDLTLERYEVREKKITKKRPRGLKAMGNMDSESE